MWWKEKMRIELKNQQTNGQMCTMYLWTMLYALCIMHMVIFTFLMIKFKTRLYICTFLLAVCTDSGICILKSPHPHMVRHKCVHISPLCISFNIVCLYMEFKVLTHARACIELHIVSDYIWDFRFVFICVSEHGWRTNMSSRMKFRPSISLTLTRVYYKFRSRNHARSQPWLSGF